MKEYSYDKNDLSFKGHLQRLMIEWIEEAEIKKAFTKKEKEYFKAAKKLDMGFMTNNYPLIEKEEKEKKNKFINACFKLFGKNIFIVPKDGFDRLLEQSDVTIGSFSDYTSEIPYKNLMKIKRIYDKYEKMHHKYMMESLSDAEHIIYDSSLTVYKENCGDTIYSKNITFRRTEVPEDGNFKRRYDMFIVASPSRMNSSMHTIFCKFDMMDMSMVCSLTNYGVIIYDIWGDEDSYCGEKQIEINLVNKLNSMKYRILGRKTLMQILVGHIYDLLRGV